MPFEVIDDCHKEDTSRSYSTSKPILKPTTNHASPSTKNQIRFDDLSMSDPQIKTANTASNAGVKRRVMFQIDDQLLSPRVATQETQLSA